MRFSILSSEYIVGNVHSSEHFQLLNNLGEPVISDYPISTILGSEILNPDEFVIMSLNEPLFNDIDVRLMPVFCTACGKPIPGQHYKQGGHRPRLECETCISVSPEPRHVENMPTCRACNGHNFMITVVVQNTYHYNGNDIDEDDDSNVIYYEVGDEVNHETVSRSISCRSCGSSDINYNAIEAY